MTNEAYTRLTIVFLLISLFLIGFLWWMYKYQSEPIWEGNILDIEVKPHHIPPKPIEDNFTPLEEEFKYAPPEAGRDKG